MVKTLFIGLDGATFTILDEVTRARPGRAAIMPFLGSLIEHGFRARLRSTNHPLTPPAWVSLMTGRHPGHHGVFDFMRFEDRGSEVYFTLSDARDIRTETLWSLASRQGRSVVSLNFPMMSPPEPVNGSLIAGFVSARHLRRAMHPHDLFDRIRKMPDFNPTELAWDFEREDKIGSTMADAELESWVRHHLPREEQWYRIAAALMTEDRPDLMAVMFDGTDKIQHQAWHVMDPALRPASPDAAFLRLEALVRDYLDKLDSYIRRLVGAAGPEAQVFLASDHGFTSSRLVLRINRFLAERGYLEFMPPGQTAAEKRRDDKNFANLRWDKTLAYCPTPSSNGICIRVAERPGQPGVPVKEYESFRRRLIADLKAIRDPATGDPVIRDIMLREQAFPGPAMRSAPDLTLVLSDYGFVSVRNLAPFIETRSVPVGTHHPDGIFIASGMGVRRGTKDLMSIVDVTPIMMHSLGLTVPEDFEGMVPDELFAPEFLAAHPVRVGPPTHSRDTGQNQGAREDEASPEERDKIMDQLRALGYLED